MKKSVDHGRSKIDQCFVSIGGVKSFTSFGRHTPDQLKCIDLLMRCNAEIHQTRHRDRYLNELIVCITGSEDDDADEPISETSFSQYRFYQTYIHELVFYPEKFDFLVRCIEESVCVVKRPAQFMDLLERICHSNKVEPLPVEVTDYDQLIEDDEERRIDAFVLRKDWKSTVPDYLTVPDPRQKRKIGGAIA